MVRIVNYQKRETQEGKEFFVLEITSGLEIVKSQNTNQFYATSKKATLPTTFDELTCKTLVGTELPGSIEKQECEPYEYTIKETGEVILLDQRNVFVPEYESKVPAKKEFSLDYNPNVDVYSKEVQLEPAF